MSADTAFWRSLVLKQLEVLMSASSTYTDEERKKYLQSIDKRLIESGSLGSRPTSTSASWQSNLSDDRSPIEYSVSIKKNACVVRLAFEPLAPSVELLSDPVNHFAGEKWLVNNKADYEDLSWHNTLSKYLIVNADTQPTLSPFACGLTQHVFAFDLVKTPLLKEYIFPDAIARQNSVSPAEWHDRKNELLFNALSAIGLSTPWQKVIDYLEQLRLATPEYVGQPEFIGWDAVEPSKARMKVYVRFARAELKHLLSHLDLGGLLDTPHTREIKAAAAELWEIFASENSSELISDDLNDCDNRTRGVIVYYELKEGKPDPVAKFYLPVRHYFSSDLVVAQRFDELLAAKHLQEPGWYLSMLERFCDHRPLDKRAGLQAMLGCAVRGGEWELSMYVSSEAYGPERFP